MSTDTLTGEMPEDEPPRGGAEVFDLQRERRRRTDPPEDAPSAGDVEPGDGESDAEPERKAARPVDPADLPEVDRIASVLASRRRPIVPEWAQSLAEARRAARVVTGHYAHVAGFHAVRVPLSYAPRLLLHAPRGFGRALRSLGAWLADAEGRPARSKAVARDDVEAYLKLSRQRNDRVRARMLLFLPVLLILAAVAVYLALFAATLWQAAAVLAAVVVFGAVGVPADKPLIGQAVVTSTVVKLTSDTVVRALGSLGIAEINKALARKDGIAFPEPITRDGPGFRAVVDLPYGVTATDVIERRDRLASGLRRPLGCVWPEPVHDQHAGRLVIWVGDQDMASSKPAPWPLSRAGRADVFKPLPFGQDQRGRLVSILLMFANLLIAAMPRQGKTFALRVILLALALDPIVEQRNFELKGTGDLSMLAPISHHYASGPDDKTIEACVVSLREVYKDLERRAKVIAGLPRELCPENKVTPQLAARKSLGLHPISFAIDECQELFTHPEFGKEAADLCTGIIKRGPAMGVILILATQRPDRDSLPTGISANVGIRFCLRVMGQVENDMALGTSAYRNGIRATTFTNRDKGIGYLVGAADDPQIARSAYLDGPASERIAERAYALRKAAGTLTGYAAGQETVADAEAKPGAGVIDDVAAVFAAIPFHADKVWGEELLTVLGEHRPEAYAGWKVETLTAVLAPYGVPSVDVGRRVGGKTVTRRGYTRADLTRAVTERDDKRSA